MAGSSDEPSNPSPIAILTSLAADSSGTKAHGRTDASVAMPLSLGQMLLQTLQRLGEGEIAKIDAVRLRLHDKCIDIPVFARSKVRIVDVLNLKQVFGVHEKTTVGA